MTDRVYYCDRCATYSMASIACPVCVVRTHRTAYVSEDEHEAAIATARAALETIARLGRDDAESDAMNTVLWAGETARTALAKLDAAGATPQDHGHG